MPPVTIPVAMGFVTSLIRRSQVEPLQRIHLNIKWSNDNVGPWVVGDKFPGLVVHVGEAIVEVGAEVGVDVLDVELSCVTHGVCGGVGFGKLSASSSYHSRRGKKPTS